MNLKGRKFDINNCNLKGVDVNSNNVFYFQTKEILDIKSFVFVTLIDKNENDIDDCFHCRITCYYINSNRILERFINFIHSCKKK